MKARVVIVIVAALLLTARPTPEAENDYPRPAGPLCNSATLMRDYALKLIAEHPEKYLRTKADREDCNQYKGSASDSSTVTSRPGQRH
jgi:hypothetical protein